MTWVETISLMTLHTEAIALYLFDHSAFGYVNKNPDLFQCPLFLSCKDIGEITFSKPIQKRK